MIFLRVELLKHREKLLKLTKLPPDELEELEQLVTQHITFINEGLIPSKHFLSAEEVIRDVDSDDIPFVALAKFLKGSLWTGDKKLKNALTSANFINITTTGELSQLLDKLER